MKDCIVHATLCNDSLLLMGTDMAGEQKLIKGNSVSLALSCSSEEEIRNCYVKLSAGGTADHQLEENFEGILFGTLTDKFGNHWILHYNKNTNL